jgi:iron complex transport system substrate-binding protein
MRERLIGRTPYCHYPPGIEDVDAVGAIVDTNYELIASKQPDLIVITVNSEGLYSNLEKLELPVMHVPHDTLGNLYDAIEEIGERCDRPATARTLVQLIRDDIGRLSRRTDSIARPLRVMITTGPMPVPARSLFVAGPDSFLGELLWRTGHVNAITEAKDVGEIPIEKLLQIDPDVILEFRDGDGSDALQDVYRAWSKIGNLQAIQNQRVRTVGGLEWLSAGPRIATVLHRMTLALDSVK